LKLTLTEKQNRTRKQLKNDNYVDDKKKRGIDQFLITGGEGKKIWELNARRFHKDGGGARWEEKMILWPLDLRESFGERKEVGRRVPTTLP